MNPQQIKLRIEMLILLDEQRINGYRLALFNTQNKQKYIPLITRLNNSKQRKEKALIHLKQFPNTNIYKLSRLYQFNIYKQ